METKKCPHCGNICRALADTEYIICGYYDSHKGYDHHGCGRDWCFKCGKILCKTWNTDTLFLESNRFHDGDCCLEHSKKHNTDYEEDYCHCLNKHVNRENISYNFGNLVLN